MSFPLLVKCCKRSFHWFQWYDSGLQEDGQCKALGRDASFVPCSASSVIASQSVVAMSDRVNT